MKTTGDIIDKLYPLLSVSSVTTTVTGRIYRRKKPLNSEVQDIEILALPIENEEGAVTHGALIIINVYAKNFDNGLPDEAKLKTITAAIIAVLEAYTGGSTAYFEFTILSESIMQDSDEPKMSYASLRILCTIEA